MLERTNTEFVRWSSCVTWLVHEPTKNSFSILKRVLPVTSVARFLVRFAGFVWERPGLLSFCQPCHCLPHYLTNRAPRCPSSHVAANTEVGNLRGSTGPHVRETLSILSNQNTLGWGAREFFHLFYFYFLENSNRCAALKRIKILGTFTCMMHVKNSHAVCPLNPVVHRCVRLRDSKKENQAFIPPNYPRLLYP